jgi:hypothetical protein
MTIPLPQLTLAFDKKTTTTNTAISHPTINLILYGNDRCMTPNPFEVQPSDSPFIRRGSVRSPECVRAPTNIENHPDNCNRPAFDEVDLEFKNQLLSFTLDLLLNNSDLVKNLAEISNKVIFKVNQLKQLIAILYLNKDDRSRYDELMDIETDELIIHTCLCNFKNPCYLRIKDIVINKSVNFLRTPWATNMSSVFRISLEHCVKEKQK